MRIALSIKKIDYNYQAVHLLKGGGEQRNEDFLKLNPGGQVPILVIDGVLISESVAILEYLEETRPEVPLLPSSPKERATVRKIVEMINAGIQPKQNLSVSRYVSSHFGGEEVAKEWGAHFVGNGLAEVEKALEKTAGKCSVGDNVTLADCALIPQFASASRFGIDTDKFPIITRIVRYLEKMPEFVAAHPSAQPDAVPL